MSLESLESALSSQLTCGELWSLLVCLERAACCGGEPRRIDVRLPLFDATAQVLRATGFTFGLPVLVTRSKVATEKSPTPPRPSFRRRFRKLGVLEARLPTLAVLWSKVAFPEPQT